MNILSIGNSFSEDAHGFLCDMFKSTGKDTYVVNACVPGCSLEMHWDYIENNTPVYMLQENGITTKTEVVFSDIIAAQKWDVITIQQVSHYSGKYETYQPYLDNIYRNLKLLCPDAKYYMHKTWAYESDFVSSNFEIYNSDQKFMYNSICDANNQAAKSINVDVIPAGDVIQYLRENTKAFDYKNGGVSFNRDGFHLTLDYGRYAATLTWTCKILGLDAFDVEFVPSVCDDEIKVNAIKNAVNVILK